MKIYAITPEVALDNWPLISPFLKRARDTGQDESSMATYMQKILNGIAHCWIIEDDTNKVVGVGLTEFLQYSQHKTLHIIAYSGDSFEQQAECFSTIAQFAKNSGCKSVEQYGRKGWAKTLPKYIPGFKEVYTVMRYDL